MSATNVSAASASQAAEALDFEVRRRGEWYGLDNWSYQEVVDFVLANTPGVIAEKGTYAAFL